MDTEKIQQIFFQHKLGKVKLVKKIEIGFTNEIYSIDDKYILKVCESESNEDKFEKEAFFYDFFNKIIPVPEVLIYDNTKKIYDKHFIIYCKIQGENLYSKWHLMNNEQRKNITKQLCEILKVINEVNYDRFVERFNLSTNIDWKKRILTSIQKLIKKVEGKKLLSGDFIERVKSFVTEHQDALKEQKIALVYWDAHFDNILVLDDVIVGVLDFERTELSSIDFGLDIIKRMVDYPKKYMSEEFEKFAKKEDYQNLLIWFKEFYPEPFEFNNLDRRLDLYSIEHDLNTLLGWPNSDEVKQMIAKTVDFQY